MPDEKDAAHPVIILLAVLEGQFIGCVQVGPSMDRSVRLTRLFVRKSWRGRDPGVSASLVGKAIEYAAERLNGSRIYVLEAHTGPKLSKIFRKKGFLPDPNGSDMLYYPLEEASSPELSRAQSGRR